MREDASPNFAPGIGFGKTLDHNLTLIKHLQALDTFQLPVMLGVSRKSLFGSLLDRPANERLAGGLAVAYHALTKGVKILRTHDVAQTVDVLKVWQVLTQQSD